VNDLDVLDGTPVVTLLSRQIEGAAAGVFADVGAACAGVRLRDSVTEPDLERARYYDQPQATFASLYPALRDAMHALARRPWPMR
jgi:hypothetical protein